MAHPDLWDYRARQDRSWTMVATPGDWPGGAAVPKKEGSSRLPGDSMDNNEGLHCEHTTDRRFVNSLLYCDVTERFNDGMKGRLVSFWRLQLPVHRGAYSPHWRWMDLAMELALLFLQRLLETSQLGRIEVGDRRIDHARAAPSDQIVATQARVNDACPDALFRRPDEKIDEMLAPLVNERRHGPVVQVIQATAEQGESLAREVLDLGREIDPTAESRLDRVLVGGGE